MLFCFPNQPSLEQPRRPVGLRQVNKLISIFCAIAPVRFQFFSLQDARSNQTFTHSFNHATRSYAYSTFSTSFALPRRRGFFSTKKIRQGLWIMAGRKGCVRVTSARWWKELTGYSLKYPFCSGTWSSNYEFSPATGARTVLLRVQPYLYYRSVSVTF